MRVEDYAIICRDVTKKFVIRGKGSSEIRKVIDSVNLSVKWGEIFGLIGPNGSGKTTLLKLICGLYDLDGGVIIVDGKRVNDIKTRIVQYINACFFREEVFPRLTVEQYLKLYSAYYLLPKETREKRINEVLTLLNLEERRKELITKLSLGMKKKLMLARVLLRDSSIIILDEPFEGLDPVSSVNFINILKKVNKDLNKTILVTSHKMEFIERLCDKLALIYNGKIIVIATPEEFKNKVFKWKVLTFTFKKLDISTEYFLKIDGVVGATIKTILTPINPYPLKKLILFCDQRRYAGIISTVLEVIKEKGNLISMSLEQPTLTDAFIKLVRDEYYGRF